MTPTKTTTTNAKRTFDSFMQFNNAEYRDGIQGLATLQPLCTKKQAYWGIKEEFLKTCKWTATEKEFEDDSVLFNNPHTFQKRDPITKKYNTEKMHCFIAPRIQIVHASSILVVDTSIKDERTGKSKNTIVGDFTMEHIKTAFDAEKKLAEEEERMSKYQCRKKYLVNIVTKDNRPAHEIPIVLTVAGLASVNLDKALQNFYLQMDKCLSASYPNSGAAAKFAKEVRSLYIFGINLHTAPMGQHDNDVCAIESVDLPEYTDMESAQAEVLRLTIPDDLREITWSQQKDPILADYINRHSKQDAARLHGAYGIAEDVPALLPQGSVQVLPASELDRKNPDTGEINLTDSD